MEARLEGDDVGLVVVGCGVAFTLEGDKVGSRVEGGGVALRLDGDEVVMRLDGGGVSTSSSRLEGDCVAFRPDGDGVTSMLVGAFVGLRRGGRVPFFVDGAGCGGDGTTSEFRMPAECAVVVLIPLLSVVVSSPFVDDVP